MKVLVTGSNGQLGMELRELAKGRNDFLFTTRKELDITNEKEVFRFFREHQLTHCINAAAYTAVDRAESEPDEAMLVNTLGPRYLSHACEISESSLIHISTDFVFSGKDDTPYKPEDNLSPLGVYGKTKSDGEKEAVRNCERVYILRTSWVYSNFGTNFVRTMLRLGNTMPEIGVVNDQSGSPTYAANLAGFLMHLLKSPEYENNFGIYHYSDKGIITWYDFAKEIMEQSGLDCKVKPITTLEYPTPAKRPVFSALDCTKTEKIFGIERMDWRIALKNCLKKMEL